MTFTQDAICVGYVMCDCESNAIKLALPVYSTPEGVMIACLRCHKPIDDCSPVRVSEVTAAGLPYSEVVAA